MFGTYYTIKQERSLEKKPDLYIIPALQLHIQLSRVVGFLLTIKSTGKVDW